MVTQALSSLLGEQTLLRPQARIVLRGANAASYVHLVQALLVQSRLNRFFPERRPLQSLLRFLAPEGSHFVYDGLEIGARTGLPTERMVTRLRADLALAEKVCREAEGRQPNLAAAPVGASTPGDDLYLRRYRYHRALLEARIPPSHRLFSRLRRIEAKSRRADFTTILDRFDLSEELFVRYTIDLRHSAPHWGRPQVRLEGDHVRVTQNFENLVSRTAAHDSELAFVLLAEIPSLEIESVARARIGPLHAAGLGSGSLLQPLLDESPGELVLSLPFDRTAVDISADHNADPLSLGYRDFLCGSSRSMVEAKRRQLGYRVFRHRKFVCTTGIAPRLRAFLERQEKPCVIHTLT